MMYADCYYHLRLEPVVISNADADEEAWCFDHAGDNLPDHVLIAAIEKRDALLAHMRRDDKDGFYRTPLRVEPYPEGGIALLTRYDIAGGLDATSPTA